MEDRIKELEKRIAVLEQQAQQFEIVRQQWFSTNKGLKQFAGEIGIDTSRYT